MAQQSALGWMRDLTIILAGMIASAMPSRRAFYLFGPKRYDWRTVEPWMVVCFAVGAHIGARTQDPRVREWVSEYTMGGHHESWVTEALSRNPKSYADAIQSDGRIAGEFESAISFTDVVEFLSKHMTFGAIFGAFGGDRTLKTVEEWIDGRGAGALQPQFRDELGFFDHWRPEPTTADIVEFVEAQMADDT